MAPGWQNIWHGPPVARWRIALLYVVGGLVLAVFVWGVFAGNTTGNKWICAAGVVVMLALLWLSARIIHRRRSHPHL
jgi:hypothetical protein